MQLVIVDIDLLRRLPGVLLLTCININPNMDK